MKPPEIQSWIDRLALDSLTIEVEGAKVKVGRLTVRDSLLIDLETGRNPLFELMDVQAMQKGKHPPLSLELQNLIFYYGLLKFYPDITREEAGDILSLLPVQERQRVIYWILTGYLPEGDRPFKFGEAGKPILNIPAWLPLLAHLYSGYTIRDLLNLDATELALLISGITEIQKFYALLIGGKKSKAKLAQPLVILYPVQLEEAKYGQRRKTAGTDRKGEAAEQDLPNL